MHAKACAGTENVEWSGQILMGFVSHAKQVHGTLKWSARVPRMRDESGMWDVMADQGRATERTERV